MSKKCGKCEKTVYPTEELKCLDKVWHKGCFKCQVCNMTLNMKNYKGYDKLPYCNAHYPKTKHTAVADTPEQRRIAENTRIQSSIKYHEDFEKSKGKYIAVPDDPETQRVKKNMQTISNVAYHGVLHQRDEQERMRPAEQVEGRRYSGSGDGEREHRRASDIASGAGNVRVRRNPGSIADYDPTETHHTNTGTPYSSRNSANMVYDSQHGPVEGQPQRKVGSISDYDPMNDNFGSITGQYTEPKRSSTANQPPQPYQPPAPQQPPYYPPQPQAPQPKRGMVCKAMYDYSAADNDEVTFNDGDIIIQCEPIDAGWMEGTVERTGQRGMLPSNYVERIGN